MSWSYYLADFCDLMLEKAKYFFEKLNKTPFVKALVMTE